MMLLKSSQATSSSWRLNFGRLFSISESINTVISSLQLFDRFHDDILIEGFSLQLLEAVTIPVITKTTRRTPVAISKARSQIGCSIFSCLWPGCLDPYMTPCWPVEPLVQICKGRCWTEYSSWKQFPWKLDLGRYFKQDGIFPTRKL
uniref:Uncharacterized protein n=1 Tax=Zea mays TaxID=4577 RepID=B7ZXL9_MAIZE|nr:unknown [Zea mays]ACR35406.1 unknown [Zea mays]